MDQVRMERRDGGRVNGWVGVVFTPSFAIT